MESGSGLRIRQVKMRQITKTFPGVRANDCVDLDINSGEVLALLGENGAGKTTLMKVLYGLYRPDAGQILVNGEPVIINSPRNAIALGIGMVHQHFMLVPSLTVAENVVLGLPSGRGPLLDLDTASQRIAALGDEYGFRVKPDAPVWQLAVGEQQRVEIIKALYRGAELLILDEPTAVLTPQEASELIAVLRGMAQAGKSLVFISHKMNEVMAVSDRVTVLRAGAVVGTVPTSEASPESLATMMVGRKIEAAKRTGEASCGKAVLELDQVWANADNDLPALKGLSLTVREGEILGLAGVSGNGQRELAEVMSGLRRVSRGNVRLRGKNLTGASPAAMIDAGLGYVPEDRLTFGIVQLFSVEENLILKDHHRPPFARGIFLQNDLVRDWSTKTVEAFDIRTPSVETRAGSLSGGNIQKVILARDITRNPAVLLACYPTRGLDIAATEYVHRRLLDVRHSGGGILLISEELDEILNLSDRIAVIYEGRIVAVAEAGSVSLEELGLLMAGANSANEADTANTEASGEESARCS